MQFLVKKPAAFGIYHFANAGMCTWYDFAKEILKDETVEVLPVTSAAFPQKAKRPAFSILDLQKTKALGFEPINWKEALDEMMGR